VPVQFEGTQFEWRGLQPAGFWPCKAPTPQAEAYATKNYGNTDTWAETIRQPSGRRTQTWL
jgi:hypothetical protein